MDSGILYIVNGINLKNYAYDFGSKNGEKIYWKYLRKFTNRELGKVFSYEANAGLSNTKSEREGFYRVFRLRSMFQNIPEIKPVKFMKKYPHKIREKDQHKFSGELWPEVKEPLKIKTVWEALCEGLL